MDMALGRVVALARALNWSLSELQRTTGVNLGITDLALMAQGSADVYPLSEALNPENPRGAVDHEMVSISAKRPLLLRADTDEMNGTSPASILPGEHLHIDLADTELVEGAVYVITDKDGAHVRLYTQARSGFVFRAENRVDHDDIPADEAHMVGRVYSVTSARIPILN